MNPLPSTDVPTEIARRITSAADQLYEENGKISFPNVDTVRRRARVNMNDASAVMRIWRCTQTASAAPLQTIIPESVQSASQTLLATVWTVATEAANSSLQMAQAGWEHERAEAEACRQQMASAFDSQTEELSAAQRNLDEREKRHAAQISELQKAVAMAEDLKSVAAAHEAKAATAEARSKEIAQRVEDLKAELLRAHVGAEQQRQETKDRLDAAEATISALREELRERRGIESDIRGELAYLRGQADAMAIRMQAESDRPDGQTNAIESSAKAKATAKPALPSATRQKGEA